MTYRIGIDVGTNSIGFAAIKIDTHGLPVKFLNSMVLTHDSGVDPNQNKRAITRLATAGTARRTRRLQQRKKKRLKELDRFIEGLGLPLTPLDSLKDPQTDQLDPYAPWKLRAQLADAPMTGEDRDLALSVALRHIARHRGWRSPYSRVESLHIAEPDSQEFTSLKERVMKEAGVVPEEGCTPAQAIRDLGIFERDPETLNYYRQPTTLRLRDAGSKTYGESSRIGDRSVAGELKVGILGGKLRQSDNANEIRKIGQMQGLDNDLVNRMIDIVFKAESPKGNAGERAGRDELPGMGAYRRAQKAHPAFQEFRIVSVVANLRIKEGKAKRQLTRDEMNAVVEFLMNVDGSDGVTWTDVAAVLNIERQALSGTADGERSYTYPPVNVTSERINRSKIGPLIDWWNEADAQLRSALVTALSNADELKEDVPGAEAVHEFLTNLSDTQLEALDTKLTLPAGRAAYSVESLTRLTARMLEDGVDLYEARKREFGVPNDWAPTPEPIGTPVGNPGVDRVLKAINRWLLSAIREWGIPESVNIEHVRSGFGSERMAREYQRDVEQRRERNSRIHRELEEKLGITVDRKSNTINKYLAIQRQNSQCVYCGSPITLNDSEMDHIVPRKGIGSTNTRENLVAICVRCNRSKSNYPFASWADSCGIPGVSVADAVARVHHWNNDDGLSRKQNWNYRNDVISRLKQTKEDEDELDNRSLESVAWMAVELHDRIAGYFKARGDEVSVSVFRGSITASARKASGFEQKVELIGGKGKTRLDRRHHAMDAATIALMRANVATVLAQRENLRKSQQLTGELQTWKDFRGSGKLKSDYNEWLNAMNKLIVLFNDALAGDKIPVVENLRLRLGSSEAHDATIRRFNPESDRKRVGDEWTRAEIDRASSEALWCALTRLEDFDPKEGLPANGDRTIRVKNEFLAADSLVNLFGTSSAAIAVRGGYAKIGGTIHHARIYRLPGKKPTYGMIRVFACDLVKHANEDLFSAKLPPQTISMRVADAKTSKAVSEGTAQYLGWVVSGDHLRFETSNEKFASGMIGDFLADFPGTVCWRISGFENDKIVNLDPVLLSKEGLVHFEVRPGTTRIFEKSYRASLQQLLTSTTVVVERRDALGRIRDHSSRGLPTTYRLN